MIVADDHLRELLRKSIPSAMAYLDLLISSPLATEMSLISQEEEATLSQALDILRDVLERAKKLGLFR